jgi:limonene-1,2-epoxide hydrolase
MKTVTATATSEQTGPLTQLVYEFIDAQRRAMEAGAKNLSDWDGMLEYIDPVNFKRVGAYLEELGWEDYRKFLANWMAGGTRFEFTEFRISEVGDTVFQEIEERHFRGDEFIRKNVIAVYRFNGDKKLVHLDIYEQAKDSGQWIIEAAKAATE